MRHSHYHTCRIGLRSLPILSVAAAHRVAGAFYSILLLHKLGPYRVLLSRTETVMFYEKGLPNKISSDRSSLGLESKIDASPTRAIASHQFEYPQGLRGEYSSTDLPIGTTNAQWRTAKVITRTTNKINHDPISDNAKYAMKTFKYDREYTINHIFGHLSQVTNSKCVIRRYGYTAADGTIELNSIIPAHFS